MSDLQPKSVVTEGHKRRRLTEPFTLTWEHDGAEFTVYVPRDGHGYEVSAPRPLRALAALFAPYYALEDVSAAHDYLYRERGFEDRVSDLQAPGGDTDARWDGTISRAEADAVLFADDSDPTWLQYAAWAYCRAFGWIAWYDYDEAIKDILPL
jgi:hypothetical protein